MSDSVKSSLASSSTTISRPVRRHLTNVYLVLAAMLAICALGSQFHSLSGGPIEMAATVGSTLGIRHMRTDNPWRWALLGTFALFSGVSLSTLISVYLHWDPSGALLLAALSCSALIFLGLSASAMLADRRSMLYVGGLAGGLASILLWTSLVNIFFARSSSLFSAELYMGLVAFAGFVVYDTQRIVEHASAGVMDVPGHALQLFMDLFSLFVRIAMIFLRKEEDRERQRRRKNSSNHHIRREPPP